MSKENGVIRVGRRGTVKFAFGEDGAPFSVDVVTAWQEWICIDEEFREREGREGQVLNQDMPEYHQKAVEFAKRLGTTEVIEKTPEGPVSRGFIEPDITTAEALEFIARLREQYDEVATFFRPRLREERDSQDSSEAELRFSVEKE